MNAKLMRCALRAALDASRHILLALSSELIARAAGVLREGATGAMVELLRVAAVAAAVAAAVLAAVGETMAPIGRLGYRRRKRLSRRQ